MACLSEEQIVQVALGLAEDGRSTAHIDECAMCRARLAEIRQVTQQLAAAHAERDGGHKASRARLLAKLTTFDVPARRISVWNRLTSPLHGLTIGQRIAAGGVSVSTAAALL